MISVVSAIIVRDSRLLLTQRPPTKDFPLAWECPGGKVEPHERHVPKIALQRELHEELGIVTKSFSIDPAWMSELLGYDMTISFYAVEIDWSYPPVPKEGQGLGYFAKRELSYLRVTPGNALAQATIASFLRSE